MNSRDNSRSNPLQLTLGTGAFALCFAVFGSVSAMMPVLKKQFHLAPVQVSIALDPNQCPCIPDYDSSRDRHFDKIRNNRKSLRETRHPRADHRPPQLLDNSCFRHLFAARLVCALAYHKEVAEILATGRLVTLEVRGARRVI